MVVATLAWLAVAAVLLIAAALKAADRTGTAVALAAYGVPGRLAAPAVGALVAVEAGLAAGLAGGIEGAAYAAALVLTVFLGAQVVALAQGNEGAPCGCLGARGRLSRASAGRTALLACACAALPLLGDGPRPPLVLAAAVAAAVVVLAAGRRSAPRGALEVDGEGPPVGEPSPLSAWFGGAAGDSRLADAGGDGLRLALFTSPGCALCKRVAPAAEAFDGAEVRLFDEVADTEAWAAGRVPGAPFAVALDGAGVVLAKGTVNDARQLGSIVEAARGRRRAAGGALGRSAIGNGVDPSSPGSPLGRSAVANGVDATSRRAFLSRAGSVAATAAGAGMVGAVIRPGDAEAYHFCGHIYTTDGCPHPTGLPRIDRRGLPLRARDGRQVDDLGRLIDPLGRPVDEAGLVLTDLDGRPLPPAPRTPVCKLTGVTHGIRVKTDGAWYRCCDGRVRKLVDCCSPDRTRINGDRALRGYCYDKRKVFCVMYFQSSVPC
jgi:hypothetical protein